MRTHKEPRRRRPGPSLVDVDPEVRNMDVEPLDVEAQPAADTADLVEELEPDDEAEDELPPDEERKQQLSEGRAEHDTGELYGMHVSPAEDRELTASEDHDAFAEAELGENWLEALGVHSAEGGPTPEREVVLVDDSDPHEAPSPTDFRDRPKADRGSGGRGGL